MSLARGMHHLRYFISDAWEEFRHSPGVNLIALSTLVAALFLGGAAGLVLSNVEASVSERLAEVRVEVYLSDAITAVERAELEALLRGAEGVEAVAYVDKMEALQRYRGWDPENAQLVASLDANPLPASFEVTLVPDTSAEQRAADLALAARRSAGVEQVQFNREWLRSVASLLDLARWAGAAFGLIVALAVVFVVANVLRLAVYARRREIDIMMTIGASPAFVRGPFLVAGLGQGLFGALLALFLVEVGRRLCLLYAEPGTQLVIGWIAARPLPWDIAAAIVAVGLLVSFLASYFAVRRTI